MGNLKSSWIVNPESVKILDRKLAINLWDGFDLSLAYAKRLDIRTKSRGEHPDLAPFRDGSKSRELAQDIEKLYGSMPNWAYESTVVVDQGEKIVALTGENGLPRAGRMVLREYFGPGGRYHAEVKLNGFDD